MSVAVATAGDSASVSDTGAGGGVSAWAKMGSGARDAGYTYIRMSHLEFHHGVPQILEFHGHFGIPACHSASEIPNPLSETSSIENITPLPIPRQLGVELEYLTPWIWLHFILFIPYIYAKNIWQCNFGSLCRQAL